MTGTLMDGLENAKMVDLVTLLEDKTQKLPHTKPIT
jgi:hypothetical protein